MPLIAVGVGYFLVRIVGKYIGAWVGCAAVKKDRLVRNYLGLALIPQAGVAIGLAALGARTLGGVMGSDLETIILASSVLYELLGPGCAKLALYLSNRTRRSSRISRSCRKRRRPANKNRTRNCSSSASRRSVQSFRRVRTRT